MLKSRQLRSGIVCVSWPLVKEGLAAGRTLSAAQQRYATLCAEGVDAVPPEYRKKCAALLAEIRGAKAKASPAGRGDASGSDSDSGESGDDGATGGKLMQESKRGSAWTPMFQ